MACSHRSLPTVSATAHAGSTVGAVLQAPAQRLVRWEAEQPTTTGRSTRALARTNSAKVHPKPDPCIPLRKGILQKLVGYSEAERERPTSKLGLAVPRPQLSSRKAAYCT